MDKQIREKILNDYKIANKNILKILEGKPNYFVKDIKQYLEPTIVTEILSLKDEQAELMYFTKIRNTLEDILTGRKVTLSCHFNEAPDYFWQAYNKSLE